MSAIGAKLIAAVRQVAAERPDHIYGESGYEHELGACLYVVEPDEDSVAPGCLVGQGLWKLGLIDHTFGRSGFNDENIGRLVGCGVIPALSELDEAEISWLADVQGEQDRGQPWGEAVQFADQIARGQRAR